MRQHAAILLFAAVLLAIIGLALYGYLTGAWETPPH